MKQVPNMISTKDLLNLTDMFNWHFNVVKKAYNYSDLCKDEEIPLCVYNCPSGALQLQKEED